MNTKSLILILLASVLGFGSFSTAKAQSTPLSLDSAISLALKNNLQVRSANLAVEQSRALQKTAFDPAKTEITLSQDPSSGGGNDNSLGASQTFAWPGLYKNQRNVLNLQTTLSEKSRNFTRAEIIRDTKTAWYSYLYNMQTLRVLDFQDSVYRNFINKSEIRYKTGETSNLELITARNKYQEVQALKKSAQTELKIQELRLQQLLNTNSPVQPVEENLPVLYRNELDTAGSTNPLIGFYRQQIEVANARVSLQKSKALPEITLGYSQQLVVKSFDPANINRGYTPGTRIAGIQLGLAVPLFNRAGRARVNSEKLAVQIAETDYLRIQNQFQVEYQQAFQEYLKNKQIVDYYTNTGLKQADEQLRIAQVSFDLGDIGYIEYIQNITLAVKSKITYLETVNLLNQSAIQLQFLKGE